MGLEEEEEKEGKSRTRAEEDVNSQHGKGVKQVKESM